MLNIIYFYKKCIIFDAAFCELAERKNLVTLKKAAFFGTAVFLQQAIFVQGGPGTQNLD